MQRLGLITLRRLSKNAPHLAWRGEPPEFSRVAAGALDLRRAPQSPALVASGKASPHASGSGASRDSTPVDAGSSDLVWCQCPNLRIPLQCRHGSWGTSGVSPGKSVLVSSGGVTGDFLPSSSSSVTLPFAWIKGSVTFTRGFPMRLSHEAFPQGCPTCHRGVSRSSA